MPEVAHTSFRSRTLDRERIPRKLAKLREERKVILDNLRFMRGEILTIIDGRQKRGLSGHGDPLEFFQLLSERDWGKYLMRQGGIPQEIRRYEALEEEIEECVRALRTGTVRRVARVLTRKPKAEPLVDIVVRGSATEGAAAGPARTIPEAPTYAPGLIRRERPSEKIDSTQKFINLVRAGHVAEAKEIFDARKDLQDIMLGLLRNTLRSVDRGNPRHLEIERLIQKIFGPLLAMKPVRDGSSAQSTPTATKEELRRQMVIHLLSAGRSAEAEAYELDDQDFFSAIKAAFISSLESVNGGSSDSKHLRVARGLRARYDTILPKANGAFVLRQMVEDICRKKKPDLAEKIRSALFIVHTLRKQVFVILGKALCSVFLLQRSVVSSSLVLFRSSGFLPFCGKKRSLNHFYSFS